MTSIKGKKSPSSGTVYTMPVLNQFTTVESQRKSMGDALRRLQQFHKAGLAFVEEGRQVAVAFREVAETMEVDGDPELEVPRNGTIRLVEFVEKITDVLRDAVAEIEHEAVAPVAATVNSSLVDTKESRREYEAVALKYENAKKKQRDASKKSQEKLKELTEEADTARAEYERAESTAAELLKTSKINAGVQCLRLFTSFYHIFEHMFASGSHVMLDMKEINQVFAGQLDAAQEELSPQAGPAGSDPVVTAFLALRDFNKTYCLQLNALTELRTKVMDDKDGLGVTEAQLGTMFLNLTEIVGLHTPLVEQLEGAVGTPEVMCSAAATAISALLPRMKKMYYAYGENASTAVFAVEAASKNSRHFASLVRKSERALMKATGLGLGLAVGVSHLIGVPTGYLPKALSLLQNLFAACNPNDPGWAALYDLLDKMKPVIELMKQASAHSDSMRSLMHVKERLAGADEEIVDPARRFVFEGDVGLAISSSPEAIPPGPAYHLTLLSDIAIISVRASSKGADLKYVAKIPVLSMAITEHPNSAEVKYGFKVEWRVGNVVTSLVFTAESEQDRVHWMGSLAGAVTDRRRIQVFAEDLVTLMARPDECHREVPRFVSRVLKYIEKNGMDVEGIYRVSGNAAEGARMQRLADSGRKLVFNDALTAASLLRAWLRSLPSSPSGPELYDEWIAMAESFKGKDAELVERSRALLQRVPRPSRFLMSVLFEHLLSVSKQSPVNLMNARNLSLIIAPPLFPSPNKADTLPSPRTFELAELFIRKCEDVFRDVITEREAFRKEEVERVAREEADRAARRERIRREKLAVPADDGANVVAASDFVAQKRVEAEAAMAEAQRKKDEEERAVKAKALEEVEKRKKAEQEEEEREERKKKEREDRKKAKIAAEAASLEEERKKKDSAQRDRYAKILEEEEARAAAERKARREEEERKRKEAAKKKKESGEAGSDDDDDDDDYEELICAGCKKEIDDDEPAVEALDQPWHKKCFVCTTCHAPLSDSATVIAGKPYCKEDGKKITSS